MCVCVCDCLLTANRVGFLLLFCCPSELLENKCIYGCLITANKVFFVVVVFVLLFFIVVVI